MKKSKREQQLDQTRKIEWIYYVISTVVIVTAMLMRAPLPVLWALAGVLMLLGYGIWVWQYRVMDELARLRFLKSWALSGLLTAVTLGIPVLWAVFRAKADKPIEDIPFWSVYGVMILSPLVASFTNVYLRKQDEKE